MLKGLIGNQYKIKGAMAANCLVPALEFEAIYTIDKNELTVELSYKTARYVTSFPRVGFEFGVNRESNKFAYVGFGPTESYIDKHVACDYGYYESSAEDNYDNNYIRPQESGSHYASKYLRVDNAFSLTADLPFSFSVTSMNL